MDGIVHVAGDGPKIVLCGVEYGIKAVPLRGMAEVEARILQDRVNPLSWFAGADLPKDETVLRIICESAFSASATANQVTPSEVNRFLNTIQGSTFLLWLMIRHNDPKVLTLDKVTDLLDTELDRRLEEGGAEAVAAWKKKFSEVADLAEGKRNPKNSSAPVAPKTGKRKATTGA